MTFTRRLHNKNYEDDLKAAIPVDASLSKESSYNKDLKEEKIIKRNDRRMKS